MAVWISIIVCCAGICSLILAVYGGAQLDYSRIAKAKHAGHRAFWIALPTTISLSWAWWNQTSGHVMLAIDSGLVLLTWSGLNEIRRNLRDFGSRFW